MIGQWTGLVCLFVLLVRSHLPPTHTFTPPHTYHPTHTPPTTHTPPSYTPSLPHAAAHTTPLHTTPTLHAPPSTTPTTAHTHTMFLPTYHTLHTCLHAPPPHLSLQNMDTYSSGRLLLVQCEFSSWSLFCRSHFLWRK